MTSFLLDDTGALRIRFSLLNNYFLPYLLQLVRIMVTLNSKYVLLFESQTSHDCTTCVFLNITKATSCAHLWTQPPQSQVSCNLEGEKRQLSFFYYALVCQGTPGPDEIVSDHKLFLMLHLVLCLHLLFGLLGLRVDSNLLQVLLKVDRFRKCLQGRVQKVNAV